MSLGNKNAKQCYTCRYWSGCKVKVKGPIFVEFDQSEEATCNKTGHKRPAWTHCKDHEKRWDF